MAQNTVLLVLQGLYSSTTTGLFFQVYFHLSGLDRNVTNLAQICADLWHVYFSIVSDFLDITKILIGSTQSLIHDGCAELCIKISQKLFCSLFTFKKFSVKPTSLFYSPPIMNNPFVQQ